MTKTIGLAMEDGAVTTDEAARIETEGTQAIIAIQATIEQAKREAMNGRAGSLAAAERRAI